MQLILIVIFILLFCAYASLLLYFTISWKSISTTLISTSPTTNISVIIAARNEEANIGRCLKSIIRQTYPAHLFEIIVVDDHSDDHTAGLVERYEQKNIKLIRLQEVIGSVVLNSYKKKAIETGIRNSSGKLIVTTDADCVALPGWLLSIADFYEKNKCAFIAAPVLISPKATFLELFQALDFMTLQGITGAAVHRNLLTMCNGANLAYERTAYEAVDGFKGIDVLASGDDMLLMHKIYEKFPDRIGFLKSPEAIIQTKAQPSLSDFFNQRIRWASKADKYNDKRLLPVLLVVYLLNVLFVAMPVFHMAIPYNLEVLSINFSLLDIWLVMIVCKTVVEIIFLIPVARFFKCTNLLFAFPLMQPFHIVYTVIAGWLGKFGKYNWKDREVK